jgi:hypothetical protein
LTKVLWLLAVQGVLGAFDTIYYHEWRARLSGGGRAMHAELKLHAARDFIYALIFGTLPWFAWQGWWVIVLVALLMAEIVITLADFVIEDQTRKQLGGVYAGERVMHALMGIVYGSMLAYLIPVLTQWWNLPTSIVKLTLPVSGKLRWTLLLMSIGVFLSGIRDIYAVLELPYFDWPWTSEMRKTHPTQETK